MNRRSLFKGLIAGSGLLFSQSLFSKSVPSNDNETLNLHKSKFPFDLNPWPIDAHFTPGKLTGILIHHRIIVPSVLINQIERIRQIDPEGIINLPINVQMGNRMSNNTIRTCIKTGLSRFDLEKKNLKNQTDILNLYRIENLVANDRSQVNLRAPVINESQLESDINCLKEKGKVVKYHMLSLPSLSFKADFLNERIENLKHLATTHEAQIYTTFRPYSYAESESTAPLNIQNLNQRIKTERFDELVSIWRKYPNQKPKPNSQMEIEITTYKGNEILTSTQALYNPQNYQITII